MFEDEVSSLSTTGLLESVVEERAAENRSATRSLVHAVVYADRFHPDASPERVDSHSGAGRERPVVLGGEGCPPIMEFAISEYGAVLGLSPGAARDYIASALALRHRFPFVWARILSEEATAWRARNLARDCEKLSLKAALYVDKKVAPLLDTISPTRLGKIIKAAKIYADPARAKAEADDQTGERGVWVSQTNEHGTKTAVIRAAAVDVNRHKAKIDEIAEALQFHGDKRSIQARRAVAVGIMSDFAFAEELIGRAREGGAVRPSDSGSPERSDTGDAPPAEAGVAGRADASECDVALAVVPGQVENSDPGGAPALALVPDPMPAPAVPPPVASSASVAPCNDSWEPRLEDEADRDAPHPGLSDLPDPLDQSAGWAAEPFDPDDDASSEAAEPMSLTEEHALGARLAEIKRDAYTRSRGQRRTRPRMGKTEVYVHLTDHTLATGSGVVRAEGIGPLLATQLGELVGYGPYVVKPVIDLNDAVSSDAYEIPDQIRERVRLAHPTELFPYGTRETSNSIDLDHIRRYDPLGPPGQTNPQNLAPLGRFGHRVKTHARGWDVRRIDERTLEWTTPHGFVFHVDPTGTRRVSGEMPDG